MRISLSLLASCLLTAGLASAQRATIPLDGEWQIEDSLSPDTAPSTWRHSVQVPGMANLAKPGFPDVDRYLTRENILNQVAFGLFPKGSPLPEPGPQQNRNYFWYRKLFRAPARRQVALLRIDKAQFGTAVWLNGRKIGEHAGCYTAGYFDITGAMDWTGENRLLVRIGAHPGVLPENIPSGTDFEKTRWTPGIYDSAAVLLSDNPVIASVQVAPRIQSSEIVVQTRLKNQGRAAARFELRQRVSTWKESREVSRPAPQSVELAPGEEKAITQTIPIPAAQLWTPETPFLYVLETSSGGDSASTRFGMREFRFDTATRRAYLNGKIYFMRGSNITLHRFFEDPDAGALPWTETWLRKLLVDIPKRMNWNSFRFCIGPVPDKWLDIADEAGLLIQNEYFIWTGHPSWASNYKHTPWDADELVRQYSEWMRDNWNHPSVVIWDANNETYDPVFADKVIPAVRGQDLSNRPWENSYNGPAGPDDPVEEHPYLQSPGSLPGGKPFEMTDLEGMTSYGRSINVPSGHATIANEYGWLWLLRDGTPTLVSKPVYDRLMGPAAKPQDRLALDAYLVAGETEFFRAHREYAGVLHFVYLTFCYPNAYTCDHFQDIPSLKLQPEFADYVREAFKPLGVYIDFWHPTLKPGSDRRFPIMMVNDKDEMVQGKLVLSLEHEGGGELARREVPFAIPGLGQQTYEIAFRVPQGEGRCLLKAAAYAAGSSESTLSRRKVALIN
jgi:beta-galactosidase